MATINGLYVFVASEDVTYGVEVTEHVVEKGVNISDHARRNAFSLSISGEIVGENAASVLSQLKKIHQNGQLCNYSGRNVFSNYMLITDFSTGHPNTVWGGCEFSMTLKEIRTATVTVNKSSTTGVTNAGTQQVTEKSNSKYVYHKVKKGDTIWALVAAKNAPYKKYGLSCNKVMELNPSAFSRKGDFRTLQIGRQIIVGIKE